MGRNEGEPTILMMSLLLCEATMRLVDIITSLERIVFPTFSVVRAFNLISLVSRRLSRRPNRPGCCGPFYMQLSLLLMFHVWKFHLQRSFASYCFSQFLSLQTLQSVRERRSLRAGRERRGMMPQRFISFHTGESRTVESLKTIFWVLQQLVLGEG